MKVQWFKFYAVYPYITKLFDNIRPFQAEMIHSIFVILIPLHLNAALLHGYAVMQSEMTTNNDDDDHQIPGIDACWTMKFNSQEWVQLAVFWIIIWTKNNIQSSTRWRKPELIHL